jgi:hypothetical protein
MQLTPWVHSKDRSKSSTIDAGAGSQYYKRMQTLITMERRWKEKCVNEFESEMLERSAIKVKHSAEAQFLHSEIVSMRVMSLEDAA